MKNLLVLLILLFTSAFTTAQQEILDDWTLHYMVIDGETINVTQPHPSNPQYHPGISIFEDASGFQVNAIVFFNGFFDSEPPVLIDATTFTVNNASVTLGDCEPYCALEGQYLGTILFGTGGSRTYTYEVINETNGNRTLIITSPEGDIAVHGDYVLATNQFEQIEIKVYPNPVGKELRIISDNYDDINEAVVYDLTGEVILTKKNSPINSIDVSSLASGIYFVQFQLSNGNRMTQKFVKR